MMIEAMAAGTPIIAGSCGSVPVVIEDGLTGFVVSSEMEAVDAIGRVHRLDPGPYPKKVRAEIRCAPYGRRIHWLLSAVARRPPKLEQ